MISVEFGRIPDGYCFGLHAQDYNSLLCKDSFLPSGGNFYSMDEDVPDLGEKIGDSAIVFVHDECLEDDEFMERVTRPNGQR